MVGVGRYFVNMHILMNCSYSICLRLFWIKFWPHKDLRTFALTVFAHRYCTMAPRHSSSAHTEEDL